MSGIAPAEGSGRERLIMVKVGIACDPDDQQHAQAAIHHPVLTLQVQHEYNDAVGRQGGS